MNLIQALINQARERSERPSKEEEILMRELMMSHTHDYPWYAHVEPRGSVTHVSCSLGDIADATY